jgi:hypothetical protein
MPLVVVGDEVETEELVFHEANPASRAFLSPSMSLGVRRGVEYVGGRKEEAEMTANEANMVSS